VSNRFTNEGWDGEERRRGTIACEFESLPLMPGTYLLDLYFGNFGDITRDFDVIREAISFEVVPADVFGYGYAAACRRRTDLLDRQVGGRGLTSRHRRSEILS
jgi:hypothetical protein